MFSVAFHNASFLRSLLLPFPIISINIIIVFFIRRNQWARGRASDRPIRQKMILFVFVVGNNWTSPFATAIAVLKHSRSTAAVSVATADQPLLLLATFCHPFLYVRCAPFSLVSDRKNSACGDDAMWAVVVSDDVAPAVTTDGGARKGNGSGV